MRLIHTADWHLGRKLKGVDRTPEIEAALTELLYQAKQRQVDAVLVAGDLFETANPTTAAERVAYQFFCGLRQAGIPAVAIAGNHDSAFRIDSIANLLSLAGVHALGKPRLADKGGVVRLDTPNGKLCVGALPFASEKRLLRAEDLWEKDSVEQQQHYRDRVNYLLKNLASGFRDDSANVLMGHLCIGSAKLSKSEREFESTGNYSLSDGMLPTDAQYIALGHIHKPQTIKAAAPTRYSGSLIQIDFGESEEEKGFNLIDLEPGSPARVEFVPIPCQKPLREVMCTAVTLDETLDMHRHHPGWLKVIVELETPTSGLADKVRKVCSQALHVEPRYPETNSQTRRRAIDPNQFDPVEEFRHFYRDRKQGTVPSTALVEAFESLYKVARETQYATD